MKKIKHTLLIFLIICACRFNQNIRTAEKTAVVPSPQVKEGIRLMNKRRFNEALKIFNLAPADPEACFQSGLAYFRMERFSEARSAFQKTRQTAPEHYQAYEWYWLTELELNKSDDMSRHLVKAEIDQILMQKDVSPGFLFSAYLGYKYLGETGKSLQLLKETAVKVKEEELKNEVAVYLLEEIIAEPDPQKRLDLAELYLTNFPQGRNFDLAGRILFQTVADLKNDELLKQYIKRYSRKKNIYLNRTIAVWLVKKGWDIEQAKSLLDDNLSLMNKPEYQEKPQFMSYGDWEFILNSFKSECLALLGEICFNRQEYSESKKYFKLAVSLGNDKPLPYYHLGELARLDHKNEEALAFFKRALEINGGAESGEKPLRELLETIHNYRGEPNIFFARNEGIVTFVPITEQLGLKNIKAQRIAWADYDQDGWTDFILDGSRLFKNIQGKRFEEVSKNVGLDKFGGYKDGVWGDYNRDGYPDLFLISYQGYKLLENNQGTFLDVSDKALPALPAMPTEEAAWGDMNNDGYPDLYLANYERPGVISGLGVQDRLLRNNGRGRFDDVTEKSGIISDEPMCGRSVVWGDVNRDGLQDILVSNYRLDPNFLWINRGHSTFVDQGESRGASGTEVEGGYGNSIASVMGDLDNDGDLDIFTANLAHPRYLEFSNKSQLLFNLGDSQFKNTFTRSGICYEESNAIPILGDIDNDGDLDLFVTAIWPGRYCHLYLNDGRGQFREISWLAGVQVQNAWGCAFVDYDNDGDLDLSVAAADGLVIFANQKIGGK
ncbi:MAG: VCBS repeat-containing protein [Candidatus Schekmanbacteria bacterium]|nr:VCBS repeat-containing protein [Candidatus Schekmanbacteria bacterium]